MPTRICSTSGCPQPATHRGRCATCASRNDRGIQRAGHAIYRTRRWQLLRRRVLFEQPICAGCDNALAVDVDHVTPLGQGGAPYARSNVQGLCKRCHGAKTRLELG
jgi:5-methylcytosine-specific restriction protein A